MGIKGLYTSKNNFCLLCKETDVINESCDHQQYTHTPDDTESVRLQLETTSVEDFLEQQQQKRNTASIAISANGSMATIVMLVEIGAVVSLMWWWLRYSIYKNSTAYWTCAT